MYFEKQKRKGGWWPAFLFTLVQDPVLANGKIVAAIVQGADRLFPGSDKLGGLLAGQLDSLVEGSLHPDDIMEGLVPVDDLGGIAGVLRENEDDFGSLGHVDLILHDSGSMLRRGSGYGFCEKDFILATVAALSNLIDFHCNSPYLSN